MIRAIALFALLAAVGVVEPTYGQEWKLWPEGAPGAKGTEPKDTPTLRVFPAPKDAQKPVPVVLLIPGGSADNNASADTPPVAAARKPNILFILVDDLGWMDLGCQGNSHLETPHVDRLARQGMRFTDAYAPAPVCSPTRAAIMTGQSPARLHITNHLPEQARFTPKTSKLLPTR